jgi:hypothetical protein
MTYSDALSASKTFASRGIVWPILLAAAVLIAYIPTIITLAQGPWQTEQEGHGPLIIVAALWLVWQSRTAVGAAALSPAPIAGWLLLFSGLALLIVSRNQDIWFLEVASEIPVIAGCVLIVAGWNVLRIVAFPIGFLIFSAPAPGWMVDAATVPLKVLISDLVTQVLYSAGYPIAQNGVVIMLDLRTFRHRRILRLCISLAGENSWANPDLSDHPDHNYCKFAPRPGACVDRLLRWRRQNRGTPARLNRYSPVHRRSDLDVFVRWLSDHIFGPRSQKSCPRTNICSCQLEIRAHTFFDLNLRRDDCLWIVFGNLSQVRRAQAFR